MSYGLNLNDVEEERVEKFRASHCGTIYYKVWNTGIGTKIHVCCEGCKAEEDISDYDSW
ncbi:MAG: hypothetical protein BWY47_00038 [Bacteroidetes bacterium ADurb.Bin302]|nr:MAG: hypothetical protein BWY47_00038 [Bacteroidetes bacterium ADurb.Bin302]